MPKDTKKMAATRSNSRMSVQKGKAAAKVKAIRRAVNDALIGLHGAPGAEEVVGVGRYMTDVEKQSAEVAFTVSDAWQRKGLGTYLLKRLVDIARGHGIQTFHAYVLVQNGGMLKIFHDSGLAVETTTEADVVHVTMKLPEAGPEEPSHA
jgi:GNAT superfamily N-acetyltransferase